MNLKMEVFAEPSAGETRYRFTWWPESSLTSNQAFFAHKPWFEQNGEMEATCGAINSNDRGYLNADPVRTLMRQVDEHETILESHY